MRKTTWGQHAMGHHGPQRTGRCMALCDGCNVPNPAVLMSGRTGHGYDWDNNRHMKTNIASGNLLHFAIEHGPFLLLIYRLKW